MHVQWWKGILLWSVHSRMSGPHTSILCCLFMPAGRSESRVLKRSIGATTEKEVQKNRKAWFAVCLPTIMGSMGGYATVIVCKSSVTSKLSWICEAPLKGVTRFRLVCADQGVAHLRTAKQRQTWWNLTCILLPRFYDFCLQFYVSARVLCLLLLLLNYMDITAFGIVWTNLNRFKSLIFQYFIVVVFSPYLFVVPIHKNRGAWCILFIKIEGA